MRKKIILFFIIFNITNLVPVFAQDQSESSDISSNQPSAINFSNRLNQLVDESQNELHSQNNKLKEQTLSRQSQMREDSAKAYYEKGLDLAEMGRYGDARIYFEKAIRITEREEMAQRIKESERRIKIQEAALDKARREQLQEKKEQQKQLEAKANKAYQEATVLYQQKKYLNSKDAFLALEKFFPNYKSTNDYLKRVDQAMLDEQKKKEDQAKRDEIMKQKALELKQKQEAEAKIKQEEQAKQEGLKKQRLEAQAKIKEEKEKKQEELRKAKEAKEQVKKQMGIDYSAALDFYKHQRFVEAKERFEGINKVFVNYKSTNYYLRRIDNDIQNQQRSEEKLAIQKMAEELPVKEAKQLLKSEGPIETKVTETLKTQEKLNEQSNLEEKAKLRNLEEQNKKQEKEAKDQIKKQLENDYAAAVVLYETQKYTEAKDKFVAIVKISPRYKSSRSYIKRIDKEIVVQKKHEEWVKLQSLKKEIPSKPLENKKSEQVVVLPTKVSNPLSNKEQQLQESKLLSDLSEQSAFLYRQISELADDRATKTTRNKLAQLDSIIKDLRLQKEQERKSQIKRIYDEAVGFFKDKNFDSAKNNFLAIESVEPNYKSTKDYLVQIKEEEKKAEENQRIDDQKMLKNQKENEERKARDLEVKKKEAQERLYQTKMDTMHGQLKEIALKSAGINDEILRLIHQNNYTGAKTRFDDLAKLMTDLRGIKNLIADEKRQYETYHSSPLEVIYKNLNNQNGSVGTRQTYFDNEVQFLKDKDSRNQNEIIYRKGIDLYKDKRYEEAKILFGELSTKGDRRAKSYLKKLDSIIKSNVLRNKFDGEKVRSEYIAEKQKQLRLKNEANAKDEENQRQLSQKLERQKRMLDEEQQNNRRHDEMLRFQEKDRQHLEDQRHKIEDKIIKQEDEYRFKKIQPTASIQQEETKSDFKKVPRSKKENHQEQINMEDEIRKEAKEEKSRFNMLKENSSDEKRAQWEKVAEKKSNLNEDRKKEIERRKLDAELKEKNRLEKERNARDQLKEKNRLENERKDQNKKQQEEKKLKLEDVLKDKQQKIEQEHRSIEKQLDRGVENMYVEAVKLFKSGNYQAAANRFSDILDIKPDYKGAHRYLEKSQERLSRSLTTSNNIQHNPSKSLLPSRNDQISKTLDLFDSNPK